MLSIFVCGACSGDLNGKPDKASARVSEYQRKLAERDFVVVIRFYSSRVLEKISNSREPEGCKNVEDCLTDASKIKGLEVSIASGQSKILKEVPVSDKRMKVMTIPPLPLSVGIDYELVFEDGDWYIDKAFWENGEVIEGFE